MIPQRDLGIHSLEDYFKEEDEQWVGTFERDLAETKSVYYQEKMGFARVDEDVLLNQARCYVVGVQWVLQYYYTGVPSWSW